MLQRVLGTKIGMTQIFDKDGTVVPVTVVNIANWVVTQVKTPAKDGYASLQLGLVKKKFRGETFAPEWLKAINDYFLHVREVELPESTMTYEVGQEIKFDHVALQEGEIVDVTGTSKGLGFQGVVKRWGFSGGPAAHGSKFHRRPGASGNMRSQGEVLKGKKFPGHLGTERVTVAGLKVVRMDKEAGCLFIKGALPGKKESLVFIKKQGK